MNTMAKQGFKRSTKSGTCSYGLAGGLALSLLTASSLLMAQDAADLERAKFIHDRLTGILPTQEMLDAMGASINNGNPQEAARLAIDGNTSKGADYADTLTPSGGFYNVTLKNWASPWTNEEQDIFQPLNDYSATIVGMVRDDRDFSEILSTNTIYTGNISYLSGTLGINISNYSLDDNNHYQQLEASSADFGNANVLVAQTQSDVTGIDPAGVAGVMTTRAAARAYFIDGTNRAMFRFTVLNHLCNDLEQFKDNKLPTDRIRRDVSRSPGGDSSIFLNECAACHTGMDAMAQAFAYHQYDYPSETDLPGASEEQRKEMGRLIYTPGVVQEKMNINGDNFLDGFVTDNDHWINYWRTGDNAPRIGWLGAPTVASTNVALDPAYSEGEGAASLGAELANTEAFAYCQVKKAFKTVCLREPEMSESTAVDNIVTAFQSGYDMKQAFIDIAVHCSAP